MKGKPSHARLKRALRGVLSGLALSATAAYSDGSPTIDFKLIHYPVSGNTLSEIKHSISVNAPSREGSTYYAGVTIWSLSSAYDLLPTAEGCRVDNGQVFLNVAVHLPHLANSSALSAPALKEWNRFSNSLKVHEMLHAQNAYRAAANLLRKVNGTKTTVPCPRAKIIAEQATSALITRIADFDLQLDKHTNHGSTQGAVLDTSIR